MYPTDFLANLRTFFNVSVKQKKTSKYPFLWHEKHKRSIIFFFSFLSGTFCQVTGWQKITYNIKYKKAADSVACTRPTLFHNFRTPKSALLLFQSPKCRWSADVMKLRNFDGTTDFEAPKLSVDYTGAWPNVSQFLMLNILDRLLLFIWKYGSAGFVVLNLGKVWSGMKKQSL